MFIFDFRSTENKHEIHKYSDMAEPDEKSVNERKL